MYLKVFGKIKVIDILMIILTILSFIFIYFISEKISIAEPDWDRINKIQQCQREYSSCANSCTTTECLNECNNRFRSCLN